VIGTRYGGEPHILGAGCPLFCCAYAIK